VDRLRGEQRSFTCLDRTTGCLLHEAKPPTPKAKAPRFALAFAASTEDFEDPVLRLCSTTKQEIVRLGDCVSVMERLRVI